MLIKYMCDSKSDTWCMRYPFQSTGRPISHRNLWSFRVYVIPLRVFVLEWDSRPGTTTGVNTPAWHFVVVSCLNKCRAISIADFPDGRNLSFHLLGMIADHRRNLGRVGKIETVPIIQICPRPSQTIGDIYDFEFSLVGTEIWDSRERLKSPIVWDFPDIRKPGLIDQTLSLFSTPSWRVDKLVRNYSVCSIFVWESNVEFIYLLLFFSFWKILSSNLPAIWKLMHSQSINQSTNQSINQFLYLSDKLT